MKRIISVFAAALFCLAASAQTPKDVKFRFTEASELNLIGKIMDNTPNPYHRVDTVLYKGFTTGENRQVRCPTGLAVLFKTNSTVISVKTEWGWEYSSVATMPIAYRGYDLYIKRDGEWVWAAAQATKPEKGRDNLVLIKDMDGSEHECLLYMPNYSEVNSCRIGIEEGASIEPLENPFRHRIVFHGSSYTHGVSTSRPGMSYPMQFMRHTGLQVLSLGVSGNCKMQPYFADVLEEVEADAYVFDIFSNPNIPLIKERLRPFIDRMVKAHPGKPIIVQRTIYWERENFDTAAQQEYGGRRALSDSLMAEICKDYKDVYYIKPDAALHNGESSTADGIHPNDNGYSLWERSIEKPILKILRKYYRDIK